MGVNCGGLNWGLTPPPAEPHTGPTFWIKAVHLKGPTLDRLLTTQYRHIPGLPLGSVDFMEHVINLIPSVTLV